MAQRSLLWPLLCVALPSAWADSDERALFDLSLDELLATTVETASKYKESFTESSAINTVISREEIKGFGANNLVEVLERVVSVHMTGSNFFPQNVMSMRGDLLGHYDNHVLMLLNGRPIRESYAGGVNFSVYTALPLSVIERIEIIRGPGSALYGTNAYSGVVNIITSKQQQSQMTATFGSFDTKALELSSHIESEELKANIALKLFDGQGWNFAAFDNNHVFGQTDYGETNVGLFADATYGNISTNLLYTSSKQLFIGASADWVAGPALDDRTMESERLFIDISHEFSFDADWLLQSHLSYSTMDFDHYNYLGKSKDTALELTTLYRPSEQLNWVIGATLWYQDVGSEARLAKAPVPDFTATWYTTYTQVDYKPFAALKLIAGLQWNKADQLDAKVVSRLGATYQLTQNIGVKLMRAQAYRAAFGVETGFSLILTNPDGSIRGGLRGNPNLAPEEITTTDAQVFYHSQQVQLAATFFHSKLSQLVTRERAADNVIDFVNKGKLTLDGWELEGKYNFNEHWHLMASYSYQFNETDTHIENFTTVPNHLFKMGAIYQSMHGVSVGVFQNYVTEATDIAVQNPAREAYNPAASQYALWSAKVSLDLGQFSPSFANTQISLYGYNITDEDIYHPDFIGKRINTLPARQGRSWYLNVSYKF